MHAAAGGSLAPASVGASGLGCAHACDSSSAGRSDADLLGREASGAGDEATDVEGCLTTFVPGSLVASRYLIRRFVGKGGMGEVYEAFDRLMAMRVALKTMRCTVSDRPHAVHQLLEEVKNALRVGHPNVCRINELQEHRDELDPDAAIPFFTMEFVDGERLGQRLKHGPLPLADARLIAHQLLDGLRAAHSRRVLHLDLKSDNVMLRHGVTPPEVVIMDFGLSRALDRPARWRSDERLLDGERYELAGTLPYMSVEQLESQLALGPASDVYSFGVVLYEMLTGRLPFVASDSDAMLLEQLERRPPPPSHYTPNLSPELDRFVLRCLASAASARFSDAGAALEALESLSSWERRVEPPARRWCWLACAAASALAVAALVDGFVQPAADTPPSGAADGASRLDSSRASTQSALPRSLPLSPSGR